jgi:hypothetical protein
MQSFLLLPQLVHTTVTNELRAVTSTSASRIRLALFPEQRALHLADISEIMSDIRWSTALFNCMLLSG